MGNTTSNSKVTVTSQDKAILNLKLQRDKLKNYQVKLSIVSKKEIEIAKQCLSKGDKKRALIALRKKKYQENLISKTDKQLEVLEELVSNIEFKQIEKNVLYGLNEGNNVLKSLNKELSLEKVEKIMDESAEGIRYQEEVTEMLGNIITNSEEDEVQEELERMEQEELERQGIKVSQPEVPLLPEVPTTKIEESDAESFRNKQKQILEEPREEPLLA